MCHHADFAAQRFLGHFRNGLTINENSAALYIMKTQ
ncbi:Uncharacterised protein [Vibrio cholerae]|nr:Uncharacterised protein [Vibrio cholerae]